VDGACRTQRGGEKYKILAQKSEEIILRGGPRYELKGNIKMDLETVGYDGVVR
jgi:hypothetical protein